MKSLESPVRDLIIKLSQEIDSIDPLIYESNDYQATKKLMSRQDYLGNLLTRCLVTIDNEINFFSNNYPLK